MPEPSARRTGARKMDENHPLLNKKTPEERKHLLALNERCGLCFIGDSQRVIWRADETKPPKFLTVRDARDRENCRVVQAKSGEKKMFDEWMRWPGRREYSDVLFAPGVNDPSIYNLFDGWNVRARQGDWSLTREHLRSVICNGNDDQFAWMMTWLAHIFQNPGDKMSVAVVIRGQKGTGKSIVFDFLQRLMPRYFFKVADSKRALSNFNAQYQNTLLLLMEEAFWAGDQAKESILKDLITSPTIAIERKGVDTVMAKNHMRIAMISNERWVVPASHDERRFAVFDCGNQHRNDIPYFKAMADQMDTGGAEAMLYDLLRHVPEGGWDILRIPPASSGLKEQMVDSLRGIDRFMFELITTGMYECDDCDEGGVFLHDDAATMVSMKDLRSAARDYLADAIGGQKAATFDLIERSVLDWFGATVVNRRAKSNMVRWVDFPSLAESRHHIRRTKGMEIAPRSIH